MTDTELLDHAQRHRWSIDAGHDRIWRVSMTLGHERVRLGGSSAGLRDAMLVAYEQQQKIGIQ